MSALSVELDERHVRRAGIRILAEQGENVEARRAQYKTARAYRMTGPELLAACQRATRSAHVSEEAREDVSQELALYVVRRHGPNPIRADVASQWLRQCAYVLGLAHARKHEVATRARALGKSEDGISDPAYARAMEMPAPELAGELESSVIVGKLAPILTPKQIEATGAAIASTRPMTGSQRVAWHAARARIKSTFPTVEALRSAIGA